jgi:hypothetical protein
MPNFRITLVAYRDVTVQAKDLDTARQWDNHRPDSELFCDPSSWSSDGIEEDLDEDAYVEVHADGTYTVLEDPDEFEDEDDLPFRGIAVVPPADSPPGACMGPLGVYLDGKLIEDLSHDMDGEGQS